MTHSSSHGKPVAAPCIVDVGTVVDKRDMWQVLSDLAHVRYCYLQEGSKDRCGEGLVLDVFADDRRSTLIVNQAIYINVFSFDYLELSQNPDQEVVIDLIQEGRQLRLIPLSSPMQDHSPQSLNSTGLETVIADVLAASLDACLDDEEHYPF
ncbi:MAG: hypothetical protein ACKO24_03110 [Leptolyngbyaceae cyanobacterium]